MGSGSSQLKCPKDYDEENFKKILLLYDKLDKNGDHSVDISELDVISKLHVKNQLIKLENMKQPLINRKHQQISKMESDLEFQIKQLRASVDLKKTQLNKETNHQIGIIDDDIKTLDNISCEERKLKFKDAITDSKDQIEFWNFFQYMKDRTNDIPNIQW
jgi:hypothetical protein